LGHLELGQSGLKTAALEKFEPLSDERFDLVLEMLHLWRVLIVHFDDTYRRRTALQGSLAQFP
jgi:hypothetical protein